MSGILFLIFASCEPLNMLSQEPLYQNYACLYSYECILHADAKYGNHILK